MDRQGDFNGEAVSKLGKPHKLQGVIHGAFRQIQNSPYQLQILPSRQIGVERGCFDKRADFAQNVEPVIGKALPVNAESAACGCGQSKKHLHCVTAGAAI